jgi:hypothetical protein
MGHALPPRLAEGRWAFPRRDRHIIGASPLTPQAFIIARPL